MYHDQTKAVISLALFLRIALCHRLLVQCMENAGAGQLGMAGISGQRLQFIHHHGIYDIGRDPYGISDLTGQDTAQIGGVLSLLTDL